MIRLLLIIPSLDESGAEKQLTLLALGLPREEFEIQVVVLTRGGPYLEPLREAGIPVKILNKRFKFDPLTLWKLRGEIKSWKPDVIHTWLFAGNTYGRMVAGGKDQPPVVVSERCVDSWKAGWQLSLDRRLVSRTARLVGNSESVVEFYRQFGYDDGKLAVIRNGLSFEVPTLIAKSDREELRREWSHGHPRPFLVGFVGRLAKQKRLEDLIWGVELLKSARDDVFLVLIGEGPERGDLERFVSYFGLRERVTFLGHRHDARTLMGAFNAFVLASDFEGQSNSLMEAMGAGLPVIVSDIPPNLELVSDRETGYVFPVGDRVELARTIQRVADAPDVRERIGESARERMHREFSVERMVSQYAALYREVVAESEQVRGTSQVTSSGGGD